ncbi:MAG TPA: hypothetical protein ENK98_08920, partial [Epsilonproteobacteria bacterium]|nr:hypothetical protein [Campylobacterota bacterium]
MIEQVNKLGYTQNYFPFTQDGLKALKDIAQKASLLNPNSRKNIFHHFPLVKQLFEDAIQKSPFDVELTDYCFYIEKNTNDRNWPLLFHKDINLPDYMNIPN